MMQQLSHASGLVSSPPNYSDDLTRTIGALQYLQVIMTTSNDPTLADVAQLVNSMQHDFGAQESLENVIQALVGRHLTAQLAHRQSSSREAVAS